MRAFTIASVAAALVASVSAHMEMTSPAPLRSKANKNTPEGKQDYSMTSPLEASGSNFPCKGYLDDTEGKESVATWQAGSSQTVTITGGANHNGGSCQLSISEDEGKTFKAIKSFEGNCPANTGEVTLDVDIPADVKDGDVVFAWTWNNRVGNREFYMNCAMVTIENGGSGLDSYPEMFVAQLSGINSCTIAEGIDVKYPNPGDQVETADGDSALGDPEGDCGSSSSGGSGGSSGGSSSSSASGPGATVSASLSVGIGGGSDATSSAAAPSATGVNNGGDGAGAGGLSSALGGASSATATGASGASASGASGASATGSASGASAAGGASGSAAGSAAGSSASGAASGTDSASGATGSAVPCDNEGEMRCDSATSWSMCGSGIWQNMGSTAGGMKCANGAMVVDDSSASNDSSSASASARALPRAYVSHKRHWTSRRHT